MSLAAGSSMVGGPTKGGKATVGSKMSAPASKGAVAKGVARRFGPLAVLMSAYEGYTGVSEANQKAEAGEITGNEATVDKSEAIAGAVGGGGGALAGAAAGAALGSVVPIVGTAIGGLVGGAIGYWAGSKGGEMAGEAIGEAIAGEDTIKDLEAQIAEEQARIDRSMSGENEYFGRESKGIENSKEKIEQLKRDLALVKKRAEAEGVPVDSSSTDIKDAEGTAGTTNKTDVNNEQKKLEAEKEKETEAKKKEEEKNKKQEEEKKKKDDELSKANQTKKTPEEVMLALNTNIEELVGLTRLSNSLAQNQLRAVRGMTNDAYTVG